MESLKELYKIGSGPSSSHTVAPQRAIKLYLDEYPQTTHLTIELYGSLSLTGKGHFTDVACKIAAKERDCDVIFKMDWDYDFPNGLIIRGYHQEKPLPNWIVYSLGGGSIQVLDMAFDFQKKVYPHSTIDSITKYCNENKIHYHDYVYQIEPDIKPYLETILDTMLDSVDRGLHREGDLPGALKVPKVAKKMLANINENLPLDQLYRIKLSGYSYAVMEENGSLGTVVTAPTCGSAGILASCLYHYHHDLNYDKQQLIDALAVAGIFGNVVKANATISGAQGGCQAEVGVGCAMASAAISFLEKGNLAQVEYAAEIGMEHHLGLTCDPVGGYVIIPCIERNAVASLRAKDAAFLANYIGTIKRNRVTFDMVVNTMKYTGSKIAIELRETSLGGLATELKIGD